MPALDQFLSSGIGRGLVHDENVGVRISGLEGRYIVSPNAESFLGYTQSEMLEMPSLDLLHSDEQDHAQTAM